MLGAANQLAFDLGRARMKAVGENLYTRVTFGSSISESFGYGRTYHLAKSDDGATFAAEATGGSLPRGVTVYAFPARVTFNRQGLARAPLTLWVVNEQFQWKLVTMSSLGKVRVQSNHGFPNPVSARWKAWWLWHCSGSQQLDLGL